MTFASGPCLVACGAPEKANFMFGNIETGLITKIVHKRMFTFYPPRHMNRSVWYAVLCCVTSLCYCLTAKLTCNMAVCRRVPHDGPSHPTSMGPGEGAFIDFYSPTQKAMRLRVYLYVRKYRDRTDTENVRKWYLRCLGIKWRQRTGHGGWVCCLLLRVSA